MRGAIIQSLSDTLGLSSASTARLVDGVLRSRRRPDQPLIGDFLALLGTGLKGAYHANPDLQGEPTAVRTDPELTFAWAGAPPADGVPGRGFSARWTGHFRPRSRSPLIFYATTDGAIRLILKVDGAERVLIDQPAGSGAPVEHASPPVALDGRALHEIRLEYRNQGAPAALALQVGTAPSAKQPIATGDLFPAGDLDSFAPVAESYRRLHKVALLVTGFGMTDAHLEWLTQRPPLLDLDALPMEPAAGAEAIGLFRRWRQLAALYALRQKLPRSNTDLFDVFRPGPLAEAIDRLVLATGWDRAALESFAGPEGLALDGTAGLGPSRDAADEPPITRLARAVDVQRRVGVAAETLFAWARATPDAEMAAAIVQAVKARYDEKRWLEVAQALNDPLRAERRDALVAYLVPRMGLRARDQLFEHFLIDVEMSPCMMSSRILQAISGVQTFFQRCLMNLEPDLPPRLIDDGDWKWLKNYRVWEANRKVFLYPENWIEPELRDDKTPLFQQLERTILQQEIKKENVEAAFADYLDGLDEISRLDVRAVWFERRDSGRLVRQARSAAQAPRSEWDHGTYHVFGRTFNAPHVWYYRRLESGRTWTPWEKLDADIDGDHLLPVMFHRRLHLFWAVFREANKPVPPQKREEKGAPKSPGKDWEIRLAYSVYDRGRWSRKRMSDSGVKDKQAFAVTEGGTTQIDGSRQWSESAYTLRASVTRTRLLIKLYRRRATPTPIQLKKKGTRSIPFPVPAARLADADVEIVARFQLDGCNGALALDGVRDGARRGPAARIEAPAGYRVSAMSFAPTRRSTGNLLALRSPHTGAMSPVFGASREAARGVRFLPVEDSQLPAGGLSPFFFQDKFRSYFARPFYTNRRKQVLVAMPLAGPAARRRALPLKRPAPARIARRWGARREDVGELALEARDAWETEQDEAWHPDDAEAARPPRAQRRASRPKQPARPARATPAVARRAVQAAPAAPAVRRVEVDEQKLRFVPFEHPGTCDLIIQLKSKGIEGLLALSTSRPPRGRDHRLVNGKWVRAARTQFEQNYSPGPLVDLSQPPHLDIDFDPDNPYAIYNWELFFHAPLQVAIRLAKDGRHDEAQRWFHFIFDPTTDVSSPPPQRYWRFAPFHENTGDAEFSGPRQLMALLSYKGQNQDLLRRQRQVLDQVTAWWEKPFSPHVIARLRISAYQKAVVMKYIDNLIEWGDKLFRRDSMESIQEATQLYILAGTILGKRPERVPPMVETPPRTFRMIRDELDAFSNYWETRFENRQVRPPFRIAARPDVGAVSSVLAMTPHFCIPVNPQMDKYWDTAADRLFKIRHCMNIQGVVRQLPLFEPPIDPGLLVRAAAAGVDLGSVIANLNAPPPHHRFRFLMTRAARLAEELRSFGAMTLQVLERRDAEGLAALRASGETALLESARDIRKKQVRQVEEEIAELSVEREHIDLQIQHLTAQTQELMSPQEKAQQVSLSAAQVISGVAEGIDLVAKVLYAIPDFQTGAAGAFSSPFVTLQLGGQMFGDISSAVATSFEKVMARNETEADLAAAQAEYQRRREEWQHELELLGKEKAQLEKVIVETQLKLEISAAELRRHDVEVENARKVERHLRDKYTSEELYGWMLGQLSGVYFQAYKVAFDAARQAERAFRFERGDPAASFIEFSYWDSLKKGLLAGERLLLDLHRLEATYLEGDRRALEVTRHISLRDDYPLALQELRATGTCQIDVTEALLDGDFPGHYFRRIKTVSLNMVGALRPHSNVNCTLTLLQNRIRTSPSASGNYAQADEAEDSRFLVNLAPVHAIATSRPGPDAGVFELRFDDERYFPFEGAGAVATWRLDMRQADNAVDLGELADVVMTVAYSARGGGAPLEAAARASREKSLARGGLRPAALHMVSLKREFPAFWKRLGEAAQGQEIELELPLDGSRFSARFRDMDVRIERVTAFAHARRAIDREALRIRVDPPKGTSTPLTGWSNPWPGTPSVRAGAEASGAPGPWKIALAANVPGSKLLESIDDVALIFELRAKKT